MCKDAEVSGLPNIISGHQFSWESKIKETSTIHRGQKYVNIERSLGNKRQCLAIWWTKFVQFKKIQAANISLIRSRFSRSDTHRWTHSSFTEDWYSEWKNERKGARKTLRGVKQKTEVLTTSEDSTHIHRHTSIQRERDIETTGGRVPFSQPWADCHSDCYIGRAQELWWIYVMLGSADLLAEGGSLTRPPTRSPARPSLGAAWLASVAFLPFWGERPAARRQLKEGAFPSSWHASLASAFLSRLLPLGIELGEEFDQDACGRRVEARGKRTKVGSDFFLPFPLRCARKAAFSTRSFSPARLHAKRNFELTFFCKK